MRTVAVRVLFAVAALYDGLLGLAFLIAGESIFTRFGVTPPNHWGYVQFPALLLITFGLMFLQIATHPGRNRNLIPYGVALKVSYCGVVFSHWLGAGIPPLWRPFAIADLVFAVLFVWAYLATAGPRTSAASSDRGEASLDG